MPVPLLGAFASEPMPVNLLHLEQGLLPLMCAFPELGTAAPSRRARIGDDT